MENKVNLLKFYFSIICSILLTAHLHAQVCPPLITSQPQNITTVAGTNVTFTVQATQGTALGLPSVTSGALKVWLKADAGVIVTSNKVSEWRDQSINTNHAFQANLDRQPVLVNGGSPFNNKPVVRFDGVRSLAGGDFMHGNGNLNLSNAYTSFLVYSEKETNVIEQLPSTVGEPGIYNSIRAYYIRGTTYGGATTNEMSFASWANDYGSGFRIPINKPRIWTLRLNDTKSQIEYFDTDGTANFATNRTTQGLITPAAGYYVGGLAFQAGQLYGLNGDIAELIYFQGKLTDSDRTEVENYLRQKYFSASLLYQWLFKGLPIAGATNSSLTLSNVQPTNSGNYSVVVSYLSASTVSSNALLTVIQPNRAPVAFSQSVSVNEDNSLPITLVATDADGDTLTYNVTAPVNGVLSGTAPNLTYTPNANFHGADSFSFKVNDGQLDSSVATVNITVISVNDAPVAVARAFPAFLFSTDEPSTVVIALCDSNAIVVLDGSLSHDVENNSLSFTWLEGTNVLASGVTVTNAFEVGTHLITLAVNDGLDTGFGSLVLEVITPAQAVAELILFVDDSRLSQNRKQPLTASLNAATASFSRCQIIAGINQLEVFQNKVRAQVAPSDPALAEQLLHISREIVIATSLNRAK